MSPEVQQVVTAASLHLGDVINDETTDEMAAEECWTLCIDAANHLLGTGPRAIDAARKACAELGYPVFSKSRPPGTPRKDYGGFHPSHHPVMPESARARIDYLFEVDTGAIAAGVPQTTDDPPARSWRPTTGSSMGWDSVVMSISWRGVEQERMVVSPKDNYAAWNLIQAIKKSAYDDARELGYDVNA